MQIVVLGGGIVGLCMANLLAMHKDFNIVLIETQPMYSEWDDRSYDLRVSAITRSTQYVLEYIGVWDEILKNRNASYDQMHVWVNSSAQINFSAEQIGESDLGHIIENRILQRELYMRLLEQNNVQIIQGTAQQLMVQAASNQILVGEQVINAQLIVGADGANSWLRKTALLDAYVRDYPHSALVATLHSEVAHENIARQRFTPDGPLAFLPLADPHLSSIVWSAAPDKIAYLLQLPAEQFCAQLKDEFEQRLGSLTLFGARASFPLRMLHAQRYIAQRIALIGDAAHVIHPLAGQGLNLGILDAAALAEVVIAAAEQNQDIGSYKILRKYERWRKGHNTNMLALMEWVKNIFVPQTGLLALARNVGLQLVNEANMLKNFMMRIALGLNDDVPKYAKKLQEAC